MDTSDKPDAPDVEILTGDQASAQERGSELARPEDVLPDRIHVLPLSERPFFPAQNVPVLIDDDPWLDTVRAIGETAHHLVGLLLVRNHEGKLPGPGDFYATGTVVRMHHPMHNSGKIQFIAEGIRRFHIVDWISGEPPYMVRVDYPDDVLGPVEDLKAYAVAIINTLKELVPLNPLYSEELKFFLTRFNPNEPSALADFAASLTTATREELQEILETVPVLERMKKVLVLIKKELEVARLQHKIREQVEERMSEQQRQFFLREQLKAIRQELGIEKDDKTLDLERFRERLDRLEVPAAARQRIDEELDKLSVLESGSPEYAVSRNYLEWLSSLPWGLYSEDRLDLAHARAVLAEDHEGIEDVKDRIIEFLAIGNLKGTVSGSIILLVGPPGVGKTSVGRSIARALGRRFYRFSLGGIRDEAEIKGHRRTYIGAMPGKFIQAIREAGVSNPLIMLDEIDKVGASYHGDPASALLEVLDPEQNADFLDHYLDVRYDLSRVLFICTANQLDSIPHPLLDRMEVIHLSGYVTREKIAIARNHLWPKLLERAAVPPGRLRISEAALRRVIEGYAREAGVRGLEKQLARIIRKAAVQFVEQDVQRLSIGARQVETYLGRPLFRRERPMTGVGIVTGLAWTAMGGATLSVEATLVHTANRGFKLTGQLGDVMRESAEIAYSYISSHLRLFKANLEFFDKAYVHLHVPEGATPKDGPSAGITMATALLSLARGERVSRPLAMTGELTLTGRVLPVGGIREKVVAARRAGIDELILPESNRGDVEELPDHLREDLQVHFVRHYRDVARLLFEI